MEYLAGRDPRGAGTITQARWPFRNAVIARSLTKLAAQPARAWRRIPAPTATAEGEVVGDVQAHPRCRKSGPSLPPQKPVEAAVEPRPGEQGREGPTGGGPRASAPRPARTRVALRRWRQPRLRVAGASRSRSIRATQGAPRSLMSVRSIDSRVQRFRCLPVIRGSISIRARAAGEPQPQLDVLDRGPWVAARVKTAALQERGPAHGSEAGPEGLRRTRRGGVDVMVEQVAEGGHRAALGTRLVGAEDGRQAGIGERRA